MDKVAEITETISSPAVSGPVRLGQAMIKSLSAPKAAPTSDSKTLKDGSTLNILMKTLAGQTNADNNTVNTTIEYIVFTTT